VRRRCLAALGALAALLCLLAAQPGGVAQAHGVLVDSSIAPGVLLPSLPRTLILHFSEDLQVSLSSLQVTGPDTTTVSIHVPREPDRRSLRIDLRPDGGGTYRVRWSSVSAADGQVVSGTYTFAVGYASAPGDLGAPFASAQASSVTGLLAAGTYWLLLLAALLWVGGALFQMPPGTAVDRPALAEGDAWVALLAPPARLLQRRLLEVLLALLAFGWLVDSARIASAGRVGLAGGGLSMIGGHLGLLRLLELLAVLAALLDLRREALAVAESAPVAGTPAGRQGGGVRALLRARGAAGRRGADPGQPTLRLLGRWGHLGLAVLFLFCLAAGGHAGGVAGITLSSIVLAWLHALAAASWIGVVGYLALVALPIVQDLDLDRRAPLMLGLLRRALPFAAAGIAGLAVSGLFAAQEEVGGLSGLRGGAYGTALDGKMLLTLVAFALTLYIFAVQMPHMARTWAARQRLESLTALGRIGNVLRALAAAGALVLGLTALLRTTLPPAIPAVPVAALIPLPSGTWNRTGLDGLAIRRLTFDPSDRHTLWAVTARGVWRSVDDQRSWQQRGQTLAKLSILDLLFLEDGRHLLAAAANGQLYRTGDAGLHWQRLGVPFGTHPLRALATHASILIAAGDDGIFRSIDRGNHWHRMSDAGGQGIASLLWSESSGRFLAGVQRGPWQIYGAGPDAASWHSLSGAAGTDVGVLTLAESAGEVGRALAGADGAGIWVAPSVESGWWQGSTGVASGSTVTAIVPDQTIVGHLYLATDGTGPYGSADGGTTWRSLGGQAPQAVHALALRPGAIRILYAGTEQGVYKLTVGP